MAEIAGTAVGIISLGIQATQYLYDYYCAVKDQKTDVASTTKRLERLLELLNALHRQLEDSEARHENKESDCRSVIEQSAQSCAGFIEELQEEVDKFKRTKDDGVSGLARTTLRRVTYPFRQSTLQKIEEAIDESLAELSAALQLATRNDLSSVQDTIDHTKEIVDLVLGGQISQNIRHWLKAPDASVDFNEACAKKHPGTGDWFIGGTEFLSWMSSPNSLLWLNGFAGCGKSVLCSTAIQHMYQQKKLRDRIGIAFFFFKFNDQGKQDASAALRSLILQLSSQLKDTAILSRLHDEYCNAVPPDHALLQCLNQLVHEFEDVYIILDALDESPRGTYRDVVLQTLHDIRDWLILGAHILVTSRDEVDIRDELGEEANQAIPMKNEGVDEDIQSFISHHLRHNRRLRVWGNHHEKIEAVLAERANGMYEIITLSSRDYTDKETLSRFRWVECQFKALASCVRTEDALDSLLESLPVTLDETYRRMLANIPMASREYAHQMLTLLCCAEGPLQPEELIEGIAVDLRGSPRYNPKRRLMDLSSLEDLCPGFIAVVEHWGYIRVQIAHFSVREYLESDRIQKHEDVNFFSMNKADAQTRMAQICFAFLLDPVQMESPLPCLFAHYALSFWHVHCSAGGCGEVLQAEAKRLLRNEQKTLQRWIYRIDRWKWPGWGHPGIDRHALSLNLASRVGLLHVLAALVKDLEADSSSSHGPGSAGIPDLINRRSLGFETPLIVASRGGHIDTVKFLLEKGAHVDPEADSEETRRETALAAAVRGAHLDIVTLLLERGADVTAASGRALGMAADIGHLQIFEALLDGMSDMNQSLGSEGYALQVVAVGKCAETLNMVAMVLDRGADVNATSGPNGSALHAAVRWHDLETIRVLLGRGADINLEGVDCEGKSVGTPLQAYANDTYLEVVAFLLERGADVNPDNGFLKSPLEVAAANASPKVMILLLDRGAKNLDPSSDQYTDALKSAEESRHGFGEVVRRVLAEGRTALPKSFEGEYS